MCQNKGVLYDFRIFIWFFSNLVDVVKIYVAIGKNMGLNDI